MRQRSSPLEEDRHLSSFDTGTIGQLDKEVSWAGVFAVSASSLGLRLARILCPRGRSVEALTFWLGVLPFILFDSTVRVRGTRTIYENVQHFFVFGYIDTSCTCLLQEDQ